ncbi:hypothetical protein [Streptomyces sp. NPDC020489]|uniref:hypothetical protein n=1 Tax=Streptomyces sp. NPDC020489 TaxID=3365077 RepID=UPI0037A197F8
MQSHLTAHALGAGPWTMTRETPDDWYETCPAEADWAVLRRRICQAGVSWPDELGRFIDGPAGVRDRPGLTAAQREFAAAKVVGRPATPPDPAAVARLADVRVG